MAILNALKGYKTYLAATGLVGLSIYQFSLGETDQAFQTFLSACTAAGLRSAISQPNP